MVPAFRIFNMQERKIWQTNTRSSSKFTTVRVDISILIKIWCLNTRSTSRFTTVELSSWRQKKARATEKCLRALYYLTSIHQIDRNQHTHSSILQFHKSVYKHFIVLQWFNRHHAKVLPSVMSTLLIQQSKLAHASKIDWVIHHNWESDDRIHSLFSNWLPPFLFLQRESHHKGITHCAQAKFGNNNHWRANSRSLPGNKRR